MIAATLDPRLLASAAAGNDLERIVYCVLGLPIDALDMPTILHRIYAAAVSRKPCLISTPNLNFLVTSRTDPEFRESVLDSDLCPPDGMPIVWIARLIGLPIKRRVSGSDVFEALQRLDRYGVRLKIFLFGGPEGVAENAAKALNSVPSGMSCVGTLAPGYGSVEEISRNENIEKVNASEADFLAVSLGAKKGQLWLHRNHARLTIPIRAHLGATINFQAGTIRRAPTWLRARGFEWLWRIKEEPYLWSRYAYDGLVFLYLIATRAVPLAALNRWYRIKSEWNPKELLINTEQQQGVATIRVFGDANHRNISKAIRLFQETLINGNQDIVIDLGGTRVIDGRFLGFLLMVRKHLKMQGRMLSFVRMSPRIRRLFWLNDLKYLIDSAIVRI